MRWNLINHSFKIWISILFHTYGCLSDRSNATSTAAKASEAHDPPQSVQIVYNHNTAIHDPCARLPLTPELWKSLELDNYLRTYPSGNNLTLEMYAESIGATNFVCGIGNMCNANQICMPVRGPDWYILVAIQNWNAFSNMMYDATGYAISILQGLVTSIVNDIVPHVNDNLAIESTLIGLFAGLCGAIPGFLFPASLNFWGSKIWPFVQGGTGLICGLAWTYHNILAMLPADEFSKTTDISYLLSKAQASTQGTIANSTAAATRLGISSPEGLYGVLKDGIFLNNHFSSGEFSEGEIQSAILRVARARLFAAIWKAKKFFIVRGSDKCTQEGPNGAISGKEVLSYCDSEGMMMNIVCSQDDKLITEFHWAYLVNAKYNITTEYVVKHSWECQQKYLTYAYDPYQNRKKKAVLDCSKMTN
ncbi:hypothetical protein CROQUDRAFT_717840 [Cronartium quercuum f. sp. fusiforme G11]|uniref:DUF7872 domain-containing protein n=1 Tax=Cronartium quercuum f. sp. fusiforme G11 TaxID=708437 RepID=A0A9P6T817_9BASI|nr:hypothetical protein CROQUDRAFT_717840 [Cronartium quercuum f. sp. fusiforme G11]